MTTRTSMRRTAAAITALLGTTIGIAAFSAPAAATVGPGSSHAYIHVEISDAWASDFNGTVLQIEFEVSPGVYEVVASTPAWNAADPDSFHGDIVTISSGNYAGVECALVSAPLTDSEWAEGWVALGLSCSNLASGTYRLTSSIVPSYYADHLECYTEDFGGASIDNYDSFSGTADIVTDSDSLVCELDVQDNDTDFYYGVNGYQVYGYTIPDSLLPGAALKHNGTSRYSTSVMTDEDVYYEVAGNSGDCYWATSLQNFEFKCDDVTVGNYTMSITPESGFVAGLAQCVSEEDWNSLPYSSMSVMSDNLTAANPMVVGANGGDPSDLEDPDIACFAYYGEGIPLYLDLDLTGDTSGATLADVTIEVYDASGSLVGTTVDPSSSFCVLDAATDSGSPTYPYEHDVVEDDSLCGVVMVPPPSEAGAEEVTYTIGLDYAGYSVESADVSVGETVVNTSVPVEPIGGGTVTLTRSTGGGFVGGALVRTDAVVFGDVLAATGPEGVTAYTFASAIFLALGIAALRLRRRFAFGHRSA